MTDIVFDLFSSFFKNKCYNLNINVFSEARTSIFLPETTLQIEYSSIFNTPRGYD